MKTVTARKEWPIAVAGLSAIGVAYGFARYGYGLFLPQLQDAFGLTVGQTGLVAGLGYAGYLGALVAVAALVTRLGPRPMIVLGGMCATAGMALVALAHGPVALIAGLVLAGTSSGWVWAPYSDAVGALLPEHRRERMLAIIPSGTAFAVVVAGPLALLAQVTGWRAAWFVFAALALASTVYNARLLPVTRGQAVAMPPPRWFLRRDATPLYLTAVSYGVLGAVYWTYAVAAIGGASTGPLFWTVMGLSGVAGVAAGRVFDRLGLGRSHTLVLLAQAAALVLIGVAPGSVTTAVASALLYGAAFMATSSLLAVWSYQVFPDRPATGFAATVFVLGTGAIAGPVVLGQVAAHAGLGVAFLATAGLTALTTLLRPR